MVWTMLSSTSSSPRSTRVKWLVLTRSQRLKVVCSQSFLTWTFWTIACWAPYTIRLEKCHASFQVTCKGKTSTWGTSWTTTLTSIWGTLRRRARTTCQTAWAGTRSHQHFALAWLIGWLRCLLTSGAMIKHFSWPSPCRTDISNSLSKKWRSATSTSSASLPCS